MRAGGKPGDDWFTVQANVWMTDDGRVHMATDDPRFTDEDGARPGLHAVFSVNLDSADYNPAQRNRFTRALRASGLPAPAEVPVLNRRLKYRAKLRRKPETPGA